MVTCNIAQVLFAIFISELTNKIYKRICQTLSFLPENLAGSAPIVAAGHTVGSVKLWSLSPTGMLQRDLQFQEASVRGLGLATAIAIVLASAAGWLYARRMIRPINQVTATAAALRSGETGARTGMRGDDPLGVLGRTLDEMADSIEADRQFERRLTADVAHELRTPLQAIQATVEAMQDGVLPADEKRLETVRNETVRLARLADSILELSRLERGSVPMQCREVDPAVPLLAALDTHRALMSPPGSHCPRTSSAGCRSRRTPTGSRRRSATCSPTPRATRPRAGR
jgi:signal transduction histidine kinase